MYVRLGTAVHKWLYICLWWYLFGSLCCSLQDSRQHAEDSQGNTVKHPAAYIEELPEDLHIRYSNICINSAHSSAEPYDPTILIKGEEAGLVDRLTRVQPETAGEEGKFGRLI